MICGFIDEVYSVLIYDMWIYERGVFHPSLWMTYGFLGLWMMLYGFIDEVYSILDMCDLQNDGSPSATP